MTAAFKKDLEAEDFLVPRTKLVSIFKKILYQTKKSNIEWRELEPGTYLADVGKCNLRLHENMLSIYDEDDQLLDSITNDDLSREHENITSLFKCARKSTLHAYEKLVELEKTLDGIL